MPTVATLEAERLREQARLDAERDPAARNRAGQFATPPDLAADVLATALDHLPAGESIRFLEPSAGSGAFVSALLVARPAAGIERMVGVETDPRFAALAARLWGPAGLSVLATDFTATPPAGRFNLLVANPPYVRHHHLDRDDKRRLQAASSAVVGAPVSGLAGLYVHFLLLADAWLAPGGVAAWLIPAEFLDVNYGAAVRRYLTRCVDLIRVHRFAAADTQFDEALVSSSVVVYRKGPPGTRPVEFTTGPSVRHSTVAAAVSRDQLDPTRKWRQLFGGRQGDAPGVRLGDLFTIRRGLATGANEFFILPRAEATARRLPAECLRAILPSPRHLHGDVIGGRPDGSPDLSPDQLLLDCRLSEREVAARHPALAEYLADGVRAGVADRYLCSRRAPWYTQESRPPAPFVVPYMGRGRGGATPFRFILNHSQATAPNVYLMLYPRGELARRLAADPRLLTVAHRALQAIGGAAISQGGRVYGGGLHKVEPGELAALDATGVLEAIGASSPVGLFDQLPRSA